MLQVMPWRAIFVVFGATGFLWAVAWFRWFRDDPAEHREVGGDELALIQKGRKVQTHPPLDAAGLRRVLSNRNMIALCLMYFTQAYGFYFNITWLPTYLKEARGFAPLSQGLLAGLPLILSAGADLLGGVTSDRTVLRFGSRLGRCGVGMVSLTVAGLTLITGAWVEDPLLSAVLIALSGAADSFLLGSAWGVCLDIAGPHAGLVTGTMNTAGQIGAFLSPILLPYMIGSKPGRGDWAIPLYVAGGLYLAGACCWLFVDPERTVLESDDRDPREPRSMARS
jgi:nitrate/nitrite transporter NarK